MRRHTRSVPPNIDSQERLFQALHHLGLSRAFAVSRVHVGAADVVREEESPGRHVFGVATEEALVIDQVRRDLLRDLLDDEFGA